MTRATVVIRSRQDREKICGWVMASPDLTRVSFAKPKRSLDQNAKMWAMLTEVAEQRPTHNGVRMTPDLWKAVFLQALGVEMAVLPSLDGQSWFPLGHRSSELSREEMANLIELILAWGAANQIIFSGEEIGG